MKFTCSALVLVLFLVSQGTAQSVKAQTNNGLPKLMPSDREIALAVSAGPANVADKATIYVLEPHGYVNAREGTNGFTCLVVRDSPSESAPVCHDPEGTRTVVPRLLAEAKLRAEGKSNKEIDRAINEGLRTGVYRFPQRVGIAYMLSTEATGPDPRDGRIIRLRPHVMFYAPFLKMDDIGASQSDLPHPDLPVVLAEGEFSAYVVMHVPDVDLPAPSSIGDLNNRATPLNGDPEMLPPDRELALALSAAPPDIASAASVYVLDSTGVIRAKEESNGFACFVERDYDPRVLSPVCYDPEGVRTVLPVELRKAELLRQHKSKPKVEADLAQGFSTGQFQPPARISVAYVLSRNGRFPTSDGGVVGGTPHVRFYAPYVRGEDIGTATKEEEGDAVGRLPILVHSGSPDAYVVVDLREDMERRGREIEHSPGA
jgi:hypothetical protein